jgi:hypothetical protein
MKFVKIVGKLALLLLRVGVQICTVCKLVCQDLLCPTNNPRSDGYTMTVPSSWKQHSFIRMDKHTQHTHTDTEDHAAARVS